jgi:hypothetical protein
MPHLLISDISVIHSGETVLKQDTKLNLNSKIKKRAELILA